ncbi:hypothetical protein R84981_002796 [Carnimonas sp. R-84981]|uniref:replication protein n=1 Tax=Carnimonas bestiolae TaxID=3402172 RepID=UPI003EDC1549
MSNTAEIYKFPDRGAETPKGPQVEDGFTRLAKPLMKELGRARLRATEYPVVLFIIDETYGWQQKSKVLAGEYIAKGLGMPRSTVASVIAELVRRKILFREGDSHGPVGFNKHYDQWVSKYQVSGKTKTPTKTKQCLENADKVSQENPDTNKDIRNTPNTNTTTAREEFEMRFDWKPSESFEDRVRMQNPTLLGYLNADTLTEFVNYWSTRSEKLSQAQWESKLTNKLVDTKRRYGERASKQHADDGKSISACPHELILNAWNTRLSSLKGAAPAPVDWMGTRYAGALENLWRKYWGGKNPSGNVRYDSVATGVDWFDRVFADLSSSQNFANSDVNIFKLFYENVFTAAINRQLQTGMGAVR